MPPSRRAPVILVEKDGSEGGIEGGVSPPSEPVTGAPHPTDCYACVMSCLYDGSELAWNDQPPMGWVACRWIVASPVHQPLATFN